MQVFTVLLLSLFLSTSYAESNDFANAQQTERYQQLLKEIRCVVCQNQSIADSNAPLAKDLRHKVYELIEAQQSNDEIKNYLVKRYGEFILLNPRLNKLTLLLWGFPCLALLLGFAIIRSQFKKNRSNCSFKND